MTRQVSSIVTFAQVLEAALERSVEAGEEAGAGLPAGPLCWPFSSWPIVIGVRVRDRP
jgi:hypothetical protein